MDKSKKKKGKELTIELIEEGIQTHHISYHPEITIDILKKLHTEFHGHGTGPSKKVNKKLIETIRSVKKQQPNMTFQQVYSYAISKTFQERIQRDLELLPSLEFLAFLYDLYPECVENFLLKIAEEKSCESKKIVDLGELENHLNHGWTFVASIENNKCIVERV